MTLAADPVRTDVPARWRRMVPPAAVIGGLAAASLALHLRDPHEQGSWGLCPSAAVASPPCRIRPLTGASGPASSQMTFSR